jgi:hypothetical protein
VATAFELVETTVAEDELQKIEPEAVINIYGLIVVALLQQSP